MRNSVFAIVCAVTLPLLAGCGEALDTGAGTGTGGGGGSVTEVTSLTVSFEGEAMQVRDGVAIRGSYAPPAYAILVANQSVGCSTTEEGLAGGDAQFVRVRVPSDGVGSWSSQAVRWFGSIDGTAEVGAVDIESTGMGTVSGQLDATFDFEQGGSSSTVEGSFTVERCF